jgi:transcription initiation factor IIF auxiliary subunit
MALEIKQGFEYRSNDWWEWWIWLDGPDSEIKQVEKVVYTLHHTFPNPVRTVTSQGDNFKLKTAGWGVFRIYATVCRKDGTTLKLYHDLVLQYPDGSPTTA